MNFSKEDDGYLHNRDQQGIMCPKKERYNGTMNMTCHGDRIAHSYQRLAHHIKNLSVKTLTFC